MSLDRMHACPSCQTLVKPGFASCPWCGHPMAKAPRPSGRQWYFLGKDDAQRGPLPEATLFEWMQRGNLTHETLVWTDGLREWLPAHAVEPFKSSLALPPGAGGPAIVFPVNPARPAPAPVPRPPARPPRRGGRSGRPGRPPAGVKMFRPARPPVRTARRPLPASRPPGPVRRPPPPPAQGPSRGPLPSSPPPRGRPAPAPRPRSAPPFRAARGPSPAAAPLPADEPFPDAPEDAQPKPADLELGADADSSIPWLPSPPILAAAAGGLAALSLLLAIAGLPLPVTLVCALLGLAGGGLGLLQARRESGPLAFPIAGAGAGAAVLVLLLAVPGLRGGGGQAGRFRQEAAAIAALRILVTSEELEAGKGTGYGDPASLLQSRPAGYRFEGGRTPEAYTFCAIPLRPGMRSFFVDESGVIRENPSGPATAASPPIQ